MIDYSKKWYKTDETVIYGNWGEKPNQPFFFKFSSNIGWRTGYYNGKKAWVWIRVPAGWEEILASRWEMISSTDTSAGNWEGLGRWRLVVRDYNCFPIEMTEAIEAGRVALTPDDIVRVHNGKPIL